jgi:predicted Zn-dependent protease
MKKLILLIILLIAGCESPKQSLLAFEKEHGLNPVTIEYNWLPNQVYPHTKDGNIIINAINQYKECEAEILIHERCHIVGLKHCTKEDCLMHYKLHKFPLHFQNKTLCNDCEAKL